MITLTDRVADRVQAADYTTWRTKVEMIGGCARPVRLSGAHQIQDAVTRKVLHHFGGDIFVPCGNRRESVCPTCSDRYAADAFHLVRAGLAGGSKGIPESVTERPRAFVTLTAPSFGKVHSRRVTARGRVVPCSCGEYHQAADSRIGSPTAPDTYDYVGSVLWQAHAGALWHRFVIALRRQIAKLAGIRVRDFGDHARLSYGKVAEYQRRGLVHFHAAVRIDGPSGAGDEPPEWASDGLLATAVKAAVACVSVVARRPDGAPMNLRWGRQADVRPIRPTAAAQVETEGGEISEGSLAAYVAKYATKGTGKSEAADRPIRSQLDIDFLTVSEHHRRIIQTAWDLGRRPEYEELNLRRWVHMLAFRGHFLTKSRYYSTTFTQIRSDRRAYRFAEILDHLGIDHASIVVVNEWDWKGSGYDNDADREIALGIATRVRDARLRKYRREVESNGDKNVGTEVAHDR